MKKFFASLLVITLLFTMVVPTMASATDGLPRPGELLADRNNWGISQLIMDGYDGLVVAISPSASGLANLDARGVIITGNSLEFYGTSVLIYENGHRIYPIHEIFADGERLTFFIDHTQTGNAEMHVRFRSVVGTVDSNLFRFNNNRVQGSYDFPASMSVTSPHRLTRPVGIGSIQDVLIPDPPRILPLTIPVPRPSVLPTTPQPPILNPGNPDVGIPPLPPEANFSDVPAGHWARPYINAMWQRGLMQGVGDNRFDPNGTLTRAQVAQILFNAYSARLPAGTASFPDVGSGRWYTAAVNWAGYHRLIDPIGGNFRPHDPAPRGITAEALHRMATRLNVTMPTIRDPVTFTDQNAIANLAAVQALQRAGVISGFPDGSFGPHRTITRAEMATLVDRFTDIPGLAPGGMVSPDPPRPPDGMIGLPAPPTVPQLRPGATLDYEWTLQPGDWLREGREGGASISIGWDGANILEGFVPTERRRLDFVLVGDVEVNGAVVIVYADGTVVEAQREVFTDGERWYIYTDVSRQGMLFEFFAAYRVVDHGHGYATIRRFGNGERFIIESIPLSLIPTSPYQTARPVGRGSVYDILYMGILDGREWEFVRTN